MNYTEKKLIGYGARQLRTKLCAITDGSVLFEHEGHAITDPFVDVTGRDAVDPIEYYDINDLLKVAEKKRSKLQFVRTQKVTVEVIKPKRHWMCSIRVEDRFETVSERVQYVTERIKTTLIEDIKLVHPEATEIRWEFEEIGQGHYIEC